MPNLYWLASYPKSGNSWMRILLANYLLDGDAPADINQLGAGQILSARQVFDDNVGVEASDLTRGEMERYRLAVYDHISAQSQAPLFVRIHDAITRTPGGHLTLSKPATAGVVYLLRNPLDIAVSLAHHNRAAVEKMVEKMADPTFTFVEAPAHHPLVQHLLTWSGHVTSWMDEPGLRVHLVRYEDLQADPIATFTAIVRFCGLHDDPARVAKAVDFSRFERVQTQEVEQGYGGKSERADSFFRSGKVGSWREGLSEELVARLVADHRAVMRRFGYLTEGGEVVY
jgi:hypothetical protein